MPIARRNIYSV